MHKGTSFLCFYVETLWLYFIYNSQQLNISVWYIQRTLHVILCSPYVVTILNNEIFQEYVNFMQISGRNAHAAARI